MYSPLNVRHWNNADQTRRFSSENVSIISYTRTEVPATIEEIRCVMGMTTLPYSLVVYATALAFTRATMGSSLKPDSKPIGIIGK